MKQQKSGSGEFKKEIGLFGGMSVICGIMIGSGIFYLGSYVLQRSGYSLGHVYFSVLFSASKLVNENVIISALFYSIKLMHF